MEPGPGPGRTQTGRHSVGPPCAGSPARCARRTARMRPRARDRAGRVPPPAARRTPPSTPPSPLRCAKRESMYGASIRPAPCANCPGGPSGRSGPESGSGSTVQNSVASAGIDCVLAWNAGARQGGGIVVPGGSLARLASQRLCANRVPRTAERQVTIVALLGEVGGRGSVGANGTQRPEARRRTADLGLPGMRHDPVPACPVPRGAGTPSFRHGHPADNTCNGARDARQGLVPTGGRQPGG